MKKLRGAFTKTCRKNLTATTDYESAIRKTDISFICAGTPSAEDGSIDLSIVRAATTSIGRSWQKRRIPRSCCQKHGGA